MRTLSVARVLSPALPVLVEALRRIRVFARFLLSAMLPG